MIDTGLISDQDMEALFFQQEAARQRKQIPAMYSGGIESWSAAFPEWKSRIDGIIKWAEGFPHLDEHSMPTGQSLYLYGPTGSGKTGLAYAIADLLIDGKRGVKCWSMIELMQAIKSTFNKSSDTTLEDILWDCQAADLLLLDDLGVEMQTNWNTAVLYQIVNGRCNALKPMIVTSNLSLDETMDGSADMNIMRICSRLKGCCKGVRMDGQDKRLETK